jgi:transposase
MVAGYERRSAALEAEVAELKERLNQNSQNSSRPPSADGPQVKRTPPRAPSGRTRGAQPGHPVPSRVLVPGEAVDEGVVCKPQPCRRWGEPWHGSDPQPWRHPVIEVPPPAPHVTEYQLHRLACARCRLTTCGTLPTGVPSRSYGPRLASRVGRCGGAYRMSKRRVANFCTEVLGVSLALGEVCPVEQTVAAALVLPVQEARAYVQAQHANVDETSWRQQQHRVWLWGAVPRGVSVFLIRTSRGAQVLREWVGASYGAVLTSDRAKAYNGQPLRHRQLCWAHLRRDFQAMLDRGGAGAAVGQRWLAQAEVLFGWCHGVRDGTWAWATFPRYMRWLRGSFRAEWEAGARCTCAKPSATCQELLRVEAALWPFVRVPGLEPTNNAAERAVPHAVHWRQTSYGTESPGGSHCVAHILTVVMTGRQQERDVLAYLTACGHAFYGGTQAPSLLPQTIG